MSQSMSDIMRIFEDELDCLGAKIGHIVSTGKIGIDGLGLFIGPLPIEDNFPEQLIRSFAKEIIHRHTFSFSFKEITLPSSGVEIACNCRKGKIIFRYLEIYEVMSDKIIKRIDVLV